MEFMRGLLEEISPLAPIPTNTEHRFERKKNIKVIIFDIYGTLLISDSGDIDRSVLSTVHLERSLDFSGIIIPGRPTREKVNTILNQVLLDFENTIRRHHDHVKSKNILFPEIDIVKIWDEVILLAVQKKQLSLTGRTDIRAMAFVFELLSNNLWPMPGMKELISELNDKNICLGILSNAQFYTPVIMNFFLTGKLLPIDYIDYFEKDLTVLSYKYLRAKPDQYLFENIKTLIVEKYKTQPDQVVFVGNDMYKDILPAKRAGFYSVLFAGDKRSLRLREDNPDVKGVVPDAVITDLGQLRKIVF